MDKTGSDLIKGWKGADGQRYLYSFILYLLTPLVMLRLLWRARKTPDYIDHWQQRFGYIQVPDKFQQGIWIHAVSFGETQAAKPLVTRLQEIYPEIPILITNTTPTGSSLVQHTWGEAVFQCYAPYDLPTVVNRFICRAKPRLAIFMETEIWPNQIHQLQKRGVPALLMNARLSEKSARGYRRVPNLTREMLTKLTAATVQDEADANRFKSLGMAADRISVTGSIKSDVFIPPSLVEAGLALRASLGTHRPVVIAASTHEGEETQVLDAFATLIQSIPEVLLILVPRHPERFDKVAQLVKKRGFHYHRRSDSGAVESTCQIYIGDSMGELILFYAAADVAFVGGSLVSVGGHNVLEPASLGIPILMGPHRFNFAQISSELIRCDGAEEVWDPTTLATAWRSLLLDVSRRDEMGQAAKEMVDKSRGALKQTVEVIQELLERHTC